MKKIFLIIFLGALLFPLVGIAGKYQMDGQTIEYEGLVPCGGKGQPACQFCHLFVMLDGIIDFVLFNIVPPLAVLMLVIGGIMFFLGGASPEILKRAKSLMTSVAIGLVIIYGAWIIINLFFTAIGVEDWTGLKEGWWQINCGEAAPTPTPAPAPAPALKIPSLLSPAHGSTVTSLTPTLDWEDVSGAGFYYWKIVILGVGDITDGTTTFSQVTVPSGKLEYNKTYTWYVRACTDGVLINCSGWSLGFTFKTPK